MLLVTICHALGDMAFQTEYMGKNKGKNRFVLLAHCITYGAVFYFVIGEWAFWWAFLSHLVIDGITSRTFPKTRKLLWIDQLAHLVFLIIIWRIYAV